MKALTVLGIVHFFMVWASYILVGCGVAWVVVKVLSKHGYI
jgi:hypothetical protein